MVIQLKYKILATIVSVGIFLIHLLFTLLYLMPINPLKQTVMQPVYNYMSLLFYQDWHLFSPKPPLGSLKLWVRCRYKNPNWTEWGDPAAETQQKHNRTRISYHGKLLNIHYTLPRELKNEWTKIVRTACGLPGSDVEISETSLSKCQQQLGEKSKMAVVLKEVENSIQYKNIVRYSKESCKAGQVKQEAAEEIEFKIVDLKSFPFSKKSEILTRPFYKIETVEFRPFKTGI